MRSANRRRCAAVAVVAIAASSIQVLDGTAARGQSSPPPSVTVCPPGPPTCDFATVPDAVTAVAPGGVVRLAPGTYAAGFTLAKDVRLVGVGAAATRISGESVTIDAGATVTLRDLAVADAADTTQLVNAGTLTLRGVDVTASPRSASSREAGAIRNDGTLTVHSSTVAGTGQHVGGILNNGVAVLIGTTVHASGGNVGGIANTGTLTLNASRVVENSAGFEGGIRNDGSLVVRNSEISNNSGQGPGGIANSGDAVVVDTAMHGNQLAGIFNDGRLTLRRVTITAWGAGLGALGGIHNGSAGSIVLDGSTVDGSAVPHQQGRTPPAIVNEGEIQLTDSIVRGSHSSDDGAGIANSGHLSLRRSTVTGNTSDGSGGGIFNTGSLVVRSSTISANTALDQAGSGLFGGGIANVPPGQVTVASGQVLGNAPDDCAGC